LDDHGKKKNQVISVSITLAYENSRNTVPKEIAIKAR
jgi:hypothetical protein